MNKIIAWLKGKKTYIVSMIGLILIALDWATGDVSFMQFIQSPEFQWFWAWVTAMALRAGIKNG